MKKRIFAAMAAALMTATVMSACGNDSTSSSNSGSTGDSTTSTSDSGSEATGDESGDAATGDAAAEAIANRTETEHLVVSWMTWSGSPTDLQMVVDEMNALTVPELNIEIEMQVTDFASRSQQMTLAMAGNEQIDLYYSTGLGLTGSVQSEYCMDLEMEDEYGNNLIETYGKDIIDTMGWDVLNTSRVNGVLYGTPTSMTSQPDAVQSMSAPICCKGRKSIWTWYPIMNRQSGRSKAATML